MFRQADKLILYALKANCRFPLSTIAKVAGLNRDTVASRIKRLEREGVIEKYYCTAFKSAVGILRYSELFVKGRFSQEEIGKIISIPEASGVVSFDNVLWVTLNTPSITRAEEVMTVIERALPNAQSFTNLTVTQCGGFDTLYFIENPPPIKEKNPVGSFHKELRSVRKEPYKGLAKLDRIDLGILEHLRLNAKLPMNDLSQDLGVDRRTVENKLRKLITTGIVRFLTTKINHQKIGYQKYLLFINTADKKKLLEVHKQNNYASGYYVFTSTWNVAIIYHYKTQKEMMDWLAYLYDQKLVTKHELHTEVKEHKFENFPPNLGEMYTQMNELIESDNSPLKR